jgi:hypothetical protein
MFAHPGGARELYLGYVLFLPTPNVVQYTAKGSCLIEYNRISNGFRLIDDFGTGWLGPASGVRLGPSAASLANSQCSIDVSKAIASVSDEMMVVTLPVTFRSGSSPVMATFLQCVDVKDNWTGMTQFGNWLVPGSSPSRPGPSIISVSATATAGSAATYTISVGHTGGAPLDAVHLRASSTIADSPACHVIYFPFLDSINLVNASGDALIAKAHIKVGTHGTLENGLCSVSTDAARSSKNAERLTIHVPITYTPAFKGNKYIFANGFDTAGRLTHWVMGAIMLVR